MRLDRLVLAQPERRELKRRAAEAVSGGGLSQTCRGHFDVSIRSFLAGSSAAARLLC